MDFTEKGKVKMVINKFLRDSDPKHGDIVTTSANQNHFAVDIKSPLPEEKCPQFYHTSTVRLLFLGKKSRSDLLTSVAFLTTRVKTPTQEDYDKLGRVVKYLRRTPKLCLTLDVTTSIWAI